MLSQTLSTVQKTKRDGKGSSIVAFPSDYVVIDIETTGLDPTYCEIIEISAIKYSQGVAIDSFTTLVKPVTAVNEYITKLTGITNEMLESAPRNAEILPQFNSFIADSILVGYNVNFDINFLYDNLMKIGVTLTNKYVDVLRIARMLLTDLPDYKLITVAKHLGITFDTTHRAMADCETCNECYTKMQAIVVEKYGTFDTFTNKTTSKSKIKAVDITANTCDFDTTHPLYNKVCVFTGALERMSRKDAMQIVADFGGICGDSVTKKTNYLILGNNDFCATLKGGKSNKLKKAESLVLSGSDIQIISENVFYDLISE